MDRVQGVSDSGVRAGADRPAGRRGPGRQDEVDAGGVPARGTVRRLEAGGSEAWISSSGATTRGSARSCSTSTGTRYGSRSSASSCSCWRTPPTRCSRPAKGAPPPRPDVLEAASPDVPGRILRHSLAARLFHWSMSVTMFVLLVTAFFPIIGLGFDWVPWHYWSGVIFTAVIVWHIVHTTFWLDFWSIWAGPKDVPEFRALMLRETGRIADPPQPAKLPAGQPALSLDPDHRRAAGHRHRRPDDVPDRHALLRPQPVPDQRAGLGLGLRPPRAGRRLAGRPRGGAHLLRPAAGPLVADQGDDLRLDHPAGSTWSTTSRTAGGSPRDKPW